MKGNSIKTIIEENHKRVNELEKVIRCAKNNTEIELAGKQCDNYCQFLCDAVQSLEKIATNIEKQKKTNKEEIDVHKQASQEIRKIKNKFARYERGLENAQRNGEIPTALNFFYDEIEFMLGYRKY